MNHKIKEINVLRLIEGAKQAKGLTVIIDVFRAFSLECYLYAMGVMKIHPVGTIEEAFRVRDCISNSILIGERHGKKCEGFDYGNSPSSVNEEKVKGKTIIHTTSAGTQGVVNAIGASEIISGSLVNAKAVAKYILARKPEVVSLVCMGNEGIYPAAEDELCAEYIKSLLEGNELENFQERIADLRYHGGEHFFDEARQEIFPEEDFWLCIKPNLFDFVIRIEQGKMGYVAQKIEMPNL